MPSLGPLRDANSVHQHQHTRCFPLLYAPHLHHLIPPVPRRQYALWSRPHNFIIPDKNDSNYIFTVIKPYTIFIPVTFISILFLSSSCTDCDLPLSHICHFIKQKYIISYALKIYSMQVIINSNVAAMQHPEWNKCSYLLYG